MSNDLEHTEAARRTGQSQSALNPKAAWPFPNTREELEAEVAALRASNTELVAALRLIVALDGNAEPGLATWNEARAKADENARTLIAKATVRCKP